MVLYVHVASHQQGFIRLFLTSAGRVAARHREANWRHSNRDCGWYFEAAQDEFKKIPGSPVAYWVSERMRDVFEEGTLLGKLVDVRQGLV